jgi:signal transduction histidine kinase
MAPVQLVPGATRTVSGRRSLVILSLLLAAIVAAGLLAVVLAAIPATRPVADGVRSPVATALLFVLIEVAFAGVGALLVVRRAAPVIGWLLVTMAFVDGVNRVGEYWSAAAVVARPGVLPAGYGMAWLDSSTEHAMPILLCAIVLLFPTGRPPSARWQWPLAFLTGGAFAALTARAVDPGPLSGVPFRVDNPIGLDPADAVLEVTFAVTAAVVVVGMVGCVASLVPRYHSASADQRRQLQWLGLACLVIAVVVPLVWLLPDPFTALYAVALAALPVAIGLAVLGVGLAAIDRAFRLTLTAFLTATALAVTYVVIVAGGGALLGRGADPWLVIVALVLIAAGAPIVWGQARRLVERLFAGPPAKPADIVADFAVAVGRQPPGAEVLERLAGVVAESTGAVVAEVWARCPSPRGDMLQRVARWPASGRAAEPVPLRDPIAVPAADRTRPVEHDGEVLGALAVQLPSGRSLRSGPARLLDELAAAAALVLQNARLIEDLRASRQRLAEAQDAERRRIERDLHDGAQQRLQALSIDLHRARARVERHDDPDVAALLDRVGIQLQEAVDELRDLARGIHPSVLTAGGLEPALRALADRAPVPVTVVVDVPARHAPSVEATAYFVACEALTNAVRHAGASHVEVTARCHDDRLLLTIADDGVGGAAMGPGGGLQGLGDRVAAVGGTLTVDSPPGGGTAVRAELPCASS